MPSLQDQLLKAGMVDKGTAQRIKKEKHKKAKKAPKDQPKTSEAQQLAEKARLEKLEKDREINRQQQLASERKAIEAQMRQLVQAHRLDRSSGEISYQFSHGKSIKKMYVDEKQQLLLTRGRVGIVAVDEQYELVPTIVAEKIAQRDESKLVLLNDPEQSKSDDDDPYADYQIPDDLMW